MLNFGVPALIFPQADEINVQDEVTVDAIAGTIENKTTGKSYSVSPIPEHLMEMITLGGLMPYLKKKIAAGELKVGAMPK